MELELKEDKHCFPCPGPRVGDVELDLKEDKHCFPCPGPGGGESGAGSEGRQTLLSLPGP